MLFKNLKSKLNLIITSGPTREFIDPIRFLSNPSTGRMGYFIARAGVNKGYRVTYITGPVSIRYRTVEGAKKNISVTSTQEMLEAVLNHIKNNSVLIMAAAPADYRPAKKYNHKIKKKDVPAIELVPNPDILRNVHDFIEARNINPAHLIGFAAETNDIETYAKDKLQKKSLDMIFLNDLTRKDSGFGTDTNQLTVFRKDGTSEKWKSEPKERLGYKIIEETESWIANKK